ncbi:MAG: transglutaminase family protein [Planctomycetota bacterium]
MAIRVALNHKTHYTFDRAVGTSPHVVRLRPAAHCRTPILAYSLNVTPEKHFINWQQDVFGNYLARLVFPEKTRELEFQVSLIAEMTVINPFDFFVEEGCEEIPFGYSEPLKKELIPYLEIRENGPLLNKWLSGVDRRPRRTIDFLVDLNQKLQKDVNYLIRMEPGVQTCEETLGKESGSCRDSGWLLVQILRHLGLASRFVSGYIVQLTPDVKPLDGPAGTDRDFLDLHAWAEVYVPGAGWIGLDPTSGLFAGEGHLPLACTPDPVSAAPVTGCTDVCEAELSVEMTLERVHEDPRVTKPYTDAEWLAIDTLGQDVDLELDAHDVRLTMGGEPTFVSIDDMDGAEWNTAALGPMKRRQAITLLKRLRDRYAEYGLLHFGQGKWYPGEELPRWALSCYWRKDGVPIWRDRTLVGDENIPAFYGVRDAEAFASALAARLGVNPKHVVSAYEDVYYYLWKEGTLPANVDPLSTDLSDSQERKRLRAVLEKGLDKVTGVALPLRWEHGVNHSGWRSGQWPFRRERLYLLPGDSPMGYRLPIDSLPWTRPEVRGPDPERCVFAPRPQLGDFHGEVARRYSTRIQMQGDPHGLREQAFADEQREDLSRFLPESSGTIYTALCVEPRGGHLYVFLPPLSHLEHYLELIAAVEATASLLGVQVMVEGYPPPYDWRIRSFQITPDPGVIEVNVFPCSSWQEMVDLTTTLYEEARQSRLGTEKFMLDGRHTGTGGGNHVTLGGLTPADSPLLRRPDLLRSLLTYWQHHPSLSYFFSGAFIGPTSQMPRVDEARNDSLYELEIAFQQLPTGRPPFPWGVDRLLRHLLIDVTGNTHRAEFCIDKLYSPESLHGRLGVLELRGFEMPPHARMSLVQQLLIRALVARFWRQPYEHHLVRWGTELHDRFLLPHYLWRDLQDVVAGMRRAGYSFEVEWFLPFFEFRFPHYGSIRVGDLEVELRMAIEPWHVLGEEVQAQGTARYVDSSVERLQVKVTGMTNPRHVITCNGRRVPLRSTGVVGEYVAGVRYRAWQPPSALHPTIPVHSPLVFDVVDLWNECSIGGCTYHVSHPGGRSFDTFPVNAYEAESRRVARFWPYGHTPHPMKVPPEELVREFPLTLDLRNQPGTG